jgi:DNA polymerase-3 subunit epsilon
MKLLFVDTETTGLDIEKDYLIEFGSVLYDSDFDSVVDFSSFMINDSDAPLESPAIKKRIKDVSDLTPDVIRKYGLDPQDAFDFIECKLNNCDYVVAVNGNKFDRPVLDAFAQPFGILPKKTWIDMLFDLDYPSNCRSKNLLYLCAFYGFINPFPHRAFFDAMSTFKVFRSNIGTTEAFEDNIVEIISMAKSPTVIISANVDYENRHLAKEHGFWWDGDNRRLWIKEVKAKIIEDKNYDFPFKIDIVEVLKSK